MLDKRAPDWGYFATNAGQLDDPNASRLDKSIEVIGPDTSEKVAYKPNIKDIKKKVEGDVKAGKGVNLMPIVNNMQVQGFSKDDIKVVVREVTITGALKDAMAAPAPSFVAGDKVLNNAQAIGKVLVEKAVAGDMQAIREVLNRTEGRVPQTNYNKNMSVNVKGDANSLMALMSKIDANK